MSTSKGYSLPVSSIPKFFSLSIDDPLLQSFTHSAELSNFINRWHRTDFGPKGTQKSDQFNNDKLLLNSIAPIQEKLAELVALINEQPLIAAIEIRDLGSERYLLKEPITIISEQYQEEVITKWPELELFGSGRSFPEAIQNLKNEIIELYEDLTNSKREELGKLPKMWSKILKKVIKKNEQVAI